MVIFFLELDTVYRIKKEKSETMGQQALHRNIFLIDGIGAMMSTVMLGAILPAFQEYIGMPRSTLYLLAVGAAFFALYSLGSFCFADVKQKKWLLLIMIANLSYCVLTAGLVMYYRELMTLFGVVYFTGEIIVIVALVAYERKVLKSIDS